MRTAIKEFILENPNLSDLTYWLRTYVEEGTIDPNVRLVAEQAIQNAQDRGDRIEAIFDFVHDTFPYIEDPIDEELFRHPKLFAREYLGGQILGGDCDDHSMLTASMLRSIGIDARIILIDTDGDGRVDHAFAEALCPNLGWVSMDTATKGMPLGWTIPTNVRVAV